MEFPRGCGGGGYPCGGGGYPWGGGGYPWGGGGYPWAADNRGAAVADNRKEVVHDTRGTPDGVEDIRREAAVHTRREVESGRTRMGRTLAEDFYGIPRKRVVVASRKQGCAHALAAGTHGTVADGLAGACGWAGLIGLADPAGCTSPSWAAQKHAQPEQEQQCVGLPQPEIRIKMCQYEGKHGDTRWWTGVPQLQQHQDLRAGRPK